jgi:D-galactarolactone cycloisomerase
VRLAKEARTYRAAGFRAMKSKIGFDVDEDIASVRAIRGALGKDGI